MNKGVDKSAGGSGESRNKRILANFALKKIINNDFFVFAIEQVFDLKHVASS